MAGKSTIEPNMTGQRGHKTGGRKSKGLRCLLLVRILAVALSVGALGIRLLLPVAQQVFHLDFSQDYRAVDGIGQVVFRDNSRKTAYKRCFWGLKQEADAEGLEEGNEPSPEGIYASPSGQLRAWTDNKSRKLYVSNMDASEIKEFDTDYSVGQIVFSPDDRYLLYKEVEYGIHGGYSTDEEYVYFKVLDLGTGSVVTVFQGYRQFFQVSWA